MFHNRIARYSHQNVTVPSARPATSAGIGTAAKPQAVVMVPMLAQQALWQGQLYRMAYQQAVADLAPPRYLSRFFSVWN